VPQNINQYFNPNWKITLSRDTYYVAMTSDEMDYNQEVVFSPFLIAQTYGNKLPLYFDTNNEETSQLDLPLVYGSYNPGNIFVSQNYYNINDEDLTCFSSTTLCDIGLTGIDNGLVDKMTGNTITFTKGLLSDNDKFDRLKFDRRMKLFQTTGYTSQNIVFSGFNDVILYEVVGKELPGIGRYHELYGGFYQGFYKLFGYDYEVMPNRMNKGWSIELILKPRLFNEFTPSSGQTTLNTLYPDNKNTFFYLGTRAENKFYHHANGSPISGYTRVTEELHEKVDTCACCDTGNTNSRCVYVYPPRSMDDKYDYHQNNGCDKCSNVKSSCYECKYCGCSTPEYGTCGWECKKHSCSSSIENTCESDPLYDSISNAISFKLSGDVKNPSICVRVLRFTGDCITADTCDSSITYTTGYTIENHCTGPIYPRCQQENPEWLDSEHWFMVNVVWQRYEFLDDCDLFYKGGLDVITKTSYLESLANNTQSLISGEYNHSGSPIPQQVELVNINEDWLREKDYRKGRLRIYLNGKIFHTIENFEEIIPRGLNTDKEKQIGVPFNISWGGGTQGLIENLTFSSSTQLNGPYIQDPECLSNDILSGTTFSGLNTNILINQHFAGTFEGAVSQFRMYVVPLSAPEVKHNFNLLKDKFEMFNPDCPDCSTIVCPENDFTYVISNGSTIESPIEITEDNKFLGRMFIPDVRDNKYLIKNNFNLIKTRINSKKVVKTPSRKPQPTPSPSPQPMLRFWNSDGWWGNQGNKPYCVGYSWAHWIEDGPVEHKGIAPIVSPELIYSQAQKLDAWPGENYDGTSVRAGAKFLKDQNMIQSYYWAFDVDTLIKAVFELGPVVVGTYWYRGMFRPDKNGIIRPTGGIIGGHAYVINGVDKNKKLFRIKNSWGKTWGKQGHAFISFNDMKKLINQNGEICIAIENNF
jgi:hypothetical protein